MSRYTAESDHDYYEAQWRWLGQRFHRTCSRCGYRWLAHEKATEFVMHPLCNRCWREAVIAQERKANG